MTADGDDQRSGRRDLDGTEGASEDGGGRTLSRWFEHWVDVQPDALALVGDDDVRLTYAEMEVAANRMANAVDAADPDRRFPSVGVAFEQSSEAVVAVMAASKTGRGVIPLDAEAPPSRVAEMLAQVAPAVVLTRGGAVDSLRDVPEDRLRIVPADELGASDDAHRVVRPIDLDGIEVVQFTSGSTGRPKGVPRSVERSIPALRRRFGDAWHAPGMHVAMTADYQWAFGWGTIRSAFATGTAVHRYSTRRRGPGDLARWLEDEQVDAWGVVPSLAQSTIDAAPAGLRWTRLRWMSLSGEPVTRRLVEQLWDILPEGAEIGNRYGASELGGVAGFAIYRDTVLDSDIVPVGRPLKGVEVEILEPDADGVGDIVVLSKRGSGGYLGAAADDDRITMRADGRNRYRTGDQGRLRPDGLLELRGRSDRTVKVRGHRVDLNDIEIVLGALPVVAEAAVGLDRPGVSGRVTAWVVPSDPSVSVTDLRRAARQRLPGYMVPTAWSFLDALPRGTRGKLDRTRLEPPPPGRPALGVPYVAPEGDLEVAIARAFERILDVAPVGRDDPFFDLGGDSLDAAETMTLLVAELGRDLPLSVFVEAETPAALAARLGSAAVPDDHLAVLAPGKADGPTVYCVHGGGGQVLNLASLAERLGEDGPFVGIQMRSTDKARALFRISNLAARYADEIAADAGDRPCIVAGHSYGATAALEVARHLRAAGRPVVAVVLLEPAPASVRWRSSGRLPELIDDDSPAKDLAYVVHAALGLRPKPHRVTTERMRAAMVGLRLHHPGTVDVPLIVLEARDGVEGRGLEGWQAHTTAGCQVRIVPGDHHSILAPPHVDVLVTELRDALSSVGAVESVGSVGEPEPHEVA